MPLDSASRPPLAAIAMLTAIALLAFAGNSLLCRLALRHTAIDAGSFTVIRLLSGALMLAGLMQLRGGMRLRAGRWAAGFALFAYAITFSYAYVSLNAGVGALLLFGSVNATMIAYGLWRGESLRPAQWAGVMVAFAGLIGLTLPGLTAPPLAGASLMIAAGVAWAAARKIRWRTRQGISCEPCRSRWHSDCWPGLGNRSMGPVQRMPSHRGRLPPGSVMRSGTRRSRSCAQQPPRRCN